ncbi:MAG TPA: PAS domain S-box protein [Planctomycetaceae bacterium]|jgi:PAS domain S-box-containing protein|nr:PAS domain S-box protein [Planctomycetaceae bacterium]
MSLAESIGRLAGSELVELRQLVESLDQIVFLVAGDLSRVYYVSPAYERITGYSCDSLYQNPRAWTELVFDVDRPFVLERLAQRLSGETQGRSEMEYRIRTADGEIRWLRNILTPVFDESGQVERLAGLAEDVTARKHAEGLLQEMHADLARKVDLRTQELSQTVTGFEREIEQRKQIEAELRRTETRFRRLFEANIIGVMFSDVYGNITDANGAFLQMTGYCRADLPMRWDKMTPPEWFHLSQLALEQLARDGTVAPLEKEYIRKDGARVPVLIGGALLDRDSWSCVFFVLDLTRRRLAEEQVREVSLQLEHASRLSVMGELLADMAHEIHQPLGVIANYANGSLKRLKKGQLTVGALKERLREIAAESMRVAEVIRRIREFIRRREPDRTLVNLNSIVMDALQFTRYERREHRVAVMVRPDRDLPAVQADRVQLTQVLVNLLSNAIHAVSSPRCEFPKILISTFVNDDGMAEIAVADNGPGIAPSDVPRIFDRFYTTKSSGLGLGLPISRSIVESHGGQLICDSQPGESTVFQVTLPPHKAPVKGSL